METGIERSLHLQSGGEACFAISFSFLGQSVPYPGFCVCPLNLNQHYTMSLRGLSDFPWLVAHLRPRVYLHLKGRYSIGQVFPGKTFWYCQVRTSG